MAMSVKVAKENLNLIAYSANIESANMSDILEMEEALRVLSMKISQQKMKL